MRPGRAVFRMSGHQQSGAAPLFRQMTVVGVGLIGGSLALAAKQAGAVQTVVGVGRSEASCSVARARGLADRVMEDLASGVPGAGLVVLAVPVREIVRLLPEVARLAEPGCVVTDVGSVKGPILAAGDAAFPDGRFVAPHPIAGKEHAGPAAARADLFRGAEINRSEKESLERRGIHVADIQGYHESLAPHQLKKT